MRISKAARACGKKRQYLEFCLHRSLSLYRGYMDLKFLQEGTKVTTSYKGLQGVTKGYKGLYPSWLIMVKISTRWSLTTVKSRLSVCSDLLSGACFNCGKKETVIAFNRSRCTIDPHQTSSRVIQCITEFINAAHFLSKLNWKILQICTLIR